ncbi:uncharacterized protein LOC126376969 [Pectinophora gossypiella]|uniref:uncharacterized protein LOC126376969 n=1 Tax=Pectinophora gossypiella TaxID=13191 RepID=UPI00214F5936|nr:uncharacterized protein LOC126376969 [Pectinophora gossypiella]
MSSKKVEDVHTTLLKKLISDSGLECLREAPISLESSEEEGMVEEQEEQLPKEESPLEEEEESVAEEVVEELPVVFPTPSLRRVIPERIRKIEEADRIHVLPTMFKTDIDPAAIPKINSTAPQKYIDIIASLVGCTKYKSSYAEYWFLDTLANLLRRAQEDGMDRTSQAVLMLWFCEWMKEMQHFDAASRERMLRRWQDNMLATALVISDQEFLPTPQECEVFYMAKDVKDKVKEPLLTIPAAGEKSKISQNSTIIDTRLHPLLMDARDEVEYNNTGYECSLRDLSKIIHYIYDLFSTDYQYNLVRSIFTFGPENVTIDPPYQIQLPKRIYTVLKPGKAKPKSPKPKDKGKPKGKKSEPDTEEYIQLMELIARDMKQQEEQEERDREEWNRKSHILPLGFAATEEFFNMYWPPPPPETPPPVVDVDPKGKKDAKKGKK